MSEHLQHIHRVERVPFTVVATKVMLSHDQRERERAQRLIAGEDDAAAVVVVGGRKVSWLRPRRTMEHGGRRATPDLRSEQRILRIVETQNRRFEHPFVVAEKRVEMGACDTPAERYFYMVMAVRERWSVRELRRQIDSALFLRYMSVKRDPEKCLPEDAECGDLWPFKDHYVLEFLGLEGEHTEKELRRAILANLRDFFLELGRDLTFVGEESAITVGNDTFYTCPTASSRPHPPQPVKPRSRPSRPQHRPEQGNQLPALQSSDAAPLFRRGSVPPSALPGQSPAIGRTE